METPKGLIFHGADHGDEVGLDLPGKPHLTVSYELLQPSQQRAWRSLSTFDTDFSSEAALAVFELNSKKEDQARELLDDLHGSSRIESLSRGRFVLHNLEREFLRKKLRPGEAEALREKQLLYFLNILLNRKWTFYSAILDDNGVFAAVKWASEHDQKLSYLIVRETMGVVQRYSCYHDPALFVRIGEKAVCEAKRLRDWLTCAMAYYLVGYGHYFVGDFKASLEPYRKAIETLEKRQKDQRNNREMGSFLDYCRLALEDSLSMMGEAPSVLETFAGQLKSHPKVEP